MPVDYAIDNPYLYTTSITVGCTELSLRIWLPIVWSQYPS